MGQIGSATHEEFVENYRFLTAACDPYISNTVKHSFTVYLKKDTKDVFLRKFLKEE
jgi:hypothetical protein